MDITSHRPNIDDLEEFMRKEKAGYKNEGLFESNHAEENWYNLIMNLSNT